MKKIFNVLLPLLFPLFGLSCMQGSSSVTTVETFDVMEVKLVDTIVARYDIAPEISTVAWEGFKPGSSQVGTVSPLSGSLVMDEGGVAAGEVIIDMNSIKVEQLSEQSANKLADHLKNSDFFEVNHYPTSKFEIVEIDSIVGESYRYAVVGNLTIKDITKAVRLNFDYTMEDSVLYVVTEPFNIDRTEWNITYKSANFFDVLKDNFIYDNIELQAAMAFVLK